MMQANTASGLKPKDPLLSQLVKTGGRKVPPETLKTFGGDPVLVEGGGYEKIWLENPAHGRRNVCQRDFATGLNNSLMFMRYQRADGADSR